LPISKIKKIAQQIAGRVNRPSTKNAAYRSHPLGRTSSLCISGRWRVACPAFWKKYDYYHETREDAKEGGSIDKKLWAMLRRIFSFSLTGQGYRNKLIRTCCPGCSCCRWYAQRRRCTDRPI